MGSGKGAVEFYVTEVKPGTVLFEIDGIPEDKAREAMNIAAHRMPCRTMFISKTTM